MIELPDRTVLRVRTAAGCVMFIERDDSTSGGLPERWWLPSGDPETWEQVQERLRAAAEWQVLSAPVAVVDALTALRAQFDEAMHAAQMAQAGGPRAGHVQVALFAERAAQALAAAAGLAPVDWSFQPEPPPGGDAPTQVRPAAVDAPTVVIPPVMDEPTEVLGAVTPLVRPGGRHARPAGRFRSWRDRGRPNKPTNSRWASLSGQPRQNWGA